MCVNLKKAIATVRDANTGGGAQSSSGTLGDDCPVVGDGSGELDVQILENGDLLENSRGVFGDCLLVWYVLGNGGFLKIH